MRREDEHFEQNKKVEPEIIRIISEITGIDEATINITTDLVKDLGIDSFAAVELQFNLEDFFFIMPR